MRETARQGAGGEESMKRLTPENSGDVTLQAVWTSMADKLTLDRNGYFEVTN